MTVGDISMKEQRIKRACDVAVSLTFLVTLFPAVYVLLGLLIKLDSSGPVIFRQARTGYGGKTFECYKFRSMYMNSTSDINQAEDDDPRITRLGRIMRRLHIDELPQFYNVLRGDMSIVGPRPHMLRQTEEFSKTVRGYGLRHAVRPGITGLAQVNGYCGTIYSPADINGRVKLDLWYVDHVSPGLDVYIFLKTITKNWPLPRKLLRKLSK